MRDDNTAPRDNQQIADVSQQSEIGMTQPYHVQTRGDRATDELAD